jgi:hypothetical protein
MLPGPPAVDSGSRGGHYSGHGPFPVIAHVRRDIRQVGGLPAGHALRTDDYHGAMRAAEAGPDHRADRALREASRCCAKYEQIGSGRRINEGTLGIALDNFGGYICGQFGAEYCAHGRGQRVHGALLSRCQFLRSRYWRVEGPRLALPCQHDLKAAVTAARFVSRPSQSASRRDRAANPGNDCRIDG